MVVDKNEEIVLMLEEEAEATEKSILFVAAEYEVDDVELANSRIRRNWTLGIFYIVLVALIWTFASFLVQYIFHDLGFHGPFFLTYIATSLFAANLPIYWLSAQAKQLYQKKTVFVVDKSKTIAQTVKISAIVAPIWFVANYAYNCSLDLTSVTSSTVVSSTSTIFTFILSVWFLNESFSWVKLAGVFLCMAGNMFTVLNDTTSTSAQGNSAVGNIVAFLAAFMYGVYTVTIRKLIPDETTSISLFFGFLGLFNMVVLLPFVVIFHYTSIASLSGLSWEILGLLVVKGLVDNVLSDYLWAKSVVLTSPTVATIGLSLTIPFAIFSDLLINHISPTFFTILASSLVVVGFILINVDIPKYANRKK